MNELVTQAAAQVPISAEAIENSLKEMFHLKTEAELQSCLVMIAAHGLNPWANEIAMIPAQGGKKPQVMYSGWLRKVGETPGYDGIEREDEVDQDGKPISCTVKIYSKNRERPDEFKADFDEWFVPSNPNWKSRPKHMLFIRAYCQAARMFTAIGAFVEGDNEVIAAGPQVVNVETRKLPSPSKGPPFKSRADQAREFHEQQDTAWEGVQSTASEIFGEPEEAKADVTVEEREALESRYGDLLMAAKDALGTAKFKAWPEDAMELPLSTLTEKVGQLEGIVKEVAK